MEGVWNFLNELKYRVKSPVVSSFFISWLVVNWKIPYALFWFDKLDYLTTGSLNLIDFAKKELNWCNSLFIPLIIAILYPVLRVVISQFQAFLNKLNSRWNKKILSNSVIPMEKYLKQRKLLEDREEMLENIISKESENISILEETRNNLTKARSELMDNEILQNKFLNKIKSDSDFTPFQGNFKVVAEFHFPDFIDLKSAEFVYISKHYLTVISTNKYEKRYTSDIVGWIYNTDKFLLNLRYPTQEQPKGAQSFVLLTNEGQYKYITMKISLGNQFSTIDLIRVE